MAADNIWYHGSNSPSITTFNVNDMGVYLSDNIWVAQNVHGRYVPYLYTVEVPDLTSLDLSQYEAYSGDESDIVQFLDKLPVSSEFKERALSNPFVPYHILEDADNEEGLVLTLKGEGYDSIIFSERGGNTIVLFDANLATIVDVKEVLEKAAAKYKPEVFLGGEVQTDWRDDVKDVQEGLKLIDPVKDDYDPATDIYEEIGDMLEADEVVFLEGGEQTEREKELLDRLDVDYKEFDELGDLQHHLDKISVVLVATEFTDGWITPDGKFIAVDYQDHLDWARNSSGVTMPDYITDDLAANPDDPMKVQYAVYSELYHNGFVRVSESTFTFDNGVTEAAFNTAMRIIKEWVWDDIQVGVLLEPNNWTEVKNKMEYGGLYRELREKLGFGTTASFDDLGDLQPHLEKISAIITSDVNDVGWVKPDGSFIRVDNQKHNEWAVTVHPDIRYDVQDDIYGEMYKLGYARVTHSGTAFSFSSAVSQVAFNTIMRIARSMAAEGWHLLFEVDSVSYTSINQMEFGGIRRELTEKLGFGTTASKVTAKEQSEKEDAEKMYNDFIETPISFWKDPQLSVEDRMALSYLAADQVAETDIKQFGLRFLTALNDVIDKDFFWEEVKKKDPRRYERLKSLDWTLETVQLSETGVWPRMGGFPNKWCYGSVLDTAEYVLGDEGDDGDVIHKQVIRDIAPNYVTIMQYLPPIIVPGEMLRDLPNYENKKWVLDDGNHRAVAAAMAGATEIIAFVGREKDKNKTSNKDYQEFKTYTDDGDLAWINPEGKYFAFNFDEYKTHSHWAYANVPEVIEKYKDIELPYGGDLEVVNDLLAQGWIRYLPKSNTAELWSDVASGAFNTLRNIFVDVLRSTEFPLSIEVTNKGEYYTASNKMELGQIIRNIRSVITTVKIAVVNSMGWIDSKGEFYDVDTSHAIWAAENILKIPLPVVEDDEDEFDVYHDPDWEWEIYTKMYDLGWARIAENNLTFGKTVNEKIFKIVMNVAKEFVWNDVSVVVEMVDGEDFDYKTMRTKSEYSEVVRYFRDKLDFDKIASKIAALSVDDFWIDSSGQPQKVETFGHKEWAIKNVLGNDFPGKTQDEVYRAMYEQGYSRYSMGTFTFGRGTTDAAFTVGMQLIRDLVWADEQALTSMDGGDSAVITNKMEFGQTMRKYREELGVTASLEIEADYEHGILMIPVPKEVRNYVLKDLATNIDFGDLNTDKNETLFGIETETHITLLYGTEGDVVESIGKYFTKPINIKTTGKIKYFDNDEASVAYLEVESPELEDLHYKLREELPNSQREGDYVPHITIAYLEPGTRLDTDDAEEFEWEVSMIINGSSDGTEQKILVGGEIPEEHVKLVADIKQAFDENGYADNFPTEVFYDNKDHFFGNLGDNEDYNDYTNWRGSFYGLPDMRRRIEDMMTSEIDPEISNIPISNKSEIADDAGAVPLNDLPPDESPGKDYEDFITTVRTDTNVPRLD